MADDLSEILPSSTSDLNTNELSNSYPGNPLQSSQEPLRQDSTDDSSLTKTQNTAKPTTFSHSDDSPFQIVQPYRRRLVPDQMQYAQEATDPQWVHNPREISESDNFNSERRWNQDRQVMHHPAFAAHPSHYHQGYDNR
jgi:hypothetical protein